MFLGWAGLGTAEINLKLPNESVTPRVLSCILNTHCKNKSASAHFYTGVVSAQFHVKTLRETYKWVLYFLSFILPDKRQKWLLKAEWTNPSEQAALIWLQSNLHDKSWLRKHNFLSQWGNMQINLNSRFFHLTKCHRSAQENVIMNRKANGAMVFS